MARLGLKLRPCEKQPQKSNKIPVHATNVYRDPIVLGIPTKTIYIGKSIVAILFQLETSTL